MASPLNTVVLVLPLIAGMMLGYYLRGKKLSKVEKSVSIIILLLIFSLGFSIGSNSKLLMIVPSVGFNAIALLTMALIFSILFAKAARKLVGI